jgi:hypothetical protein
MSNHLSAEGWLRTLLTPEQRNLGKKIQQLLEQGPEHRPSLMNEENPFPTKKGLPFAM